MRDGARRSTGVWVESGWMKRAEPVVSVIISSGSASQVRATVQSARSQTLRGVEVLTSEGSAAAGAYVMFVSAGRVLERHACMTLYSAARRSGAPVVSGCGERGADGCSIGLHTAAREISGTAELPPDGLLFRRDFLEQHGRTCASAERVLVLPHSVLRADRPLRRTTKDREGLKRWVYHRVLLRLPVRRGSVVFESQEGGAYGGSPRAIYEQLSASGHPARPTWSYAGSADGFPARAVRRGSWAYLWALARAQVWVDDRGFPADLRKRAATTYIQTSYGTPLALRGFDAPATRMTSRGDQKDLQRAINRVDYLVVGSDYERDTLERALRPKARFLAVGQPRNDALITGGDLERVERLRDELGVSGRVAVLCAPEQTEFDLGELADQLGEGMVLMAYGAQPGGRVVDVSGVPDLTSLLLASDVLVTDWAQVMFDFALLDRPIILHAPGLEAHTRRQGAYFDLAAEAPGPLTRTTAELVGALRQIEVVRENYREARRAFAQRFGQHENGNAAKTIVEQFF